MGDELSARREAKAELPGEGKGERPEPEMILEGRRKLNLSVGGPAPQLASATLRTKTIPIPAGQYDKHDELDLVIRVRCTNISFPDKSEKGVLFTERKHDFELVRVERVD